MPYVLSFIYLPGRVFAKIDSLIIVIITGLLAKIKIKLKI